MDDVLVAYEKEAARAERLAGATRQAAGMGFARLVFVIAVGITAGLALHDLFRAVLAFVWKAIVST